MCKLRLRTRQSMGFEAGGSWGEYCLVADLEQVVYLMKDVLRNPTSRFRLDFCSIGAKSVRNGPDVE